ncbi:MAG: RNase adapter RapZ [Mogibacterium sp.]|nr:RNase adapter RapZ [Mogibacterium sp.]
MKVVIITGMSGAGRSKAADWFEDQGYYCVDNMPPALIGNFLEMAAAGSNSIEKVAFVADLRSRSFFDTLAKSIDELRKRQGIELTVLFMEASTSEIVRRYNEVRRNHPLSGAEASEAVIDEEKEKLKDIKERADFVLDTTKLKPAELNAELDRLLFGGSGSSNFSINISSFGFKYGIPSEADIMLDVRFIPNPFWVPSLKKLSGNNKKVADFVFKHEIAESFVEDSHELIKKMIPGYINEGKYHLNIAFGCTGGHHRSVAIANAMAEKFEADGLRVHVTHRDLALQKSQ